MRREQRRGMILASARRVFASKGYHAAAVEDIVREAGIARGTFYLYFESKRAVFDALLDQLFAELDGQIFRVDDGAGAEEIGRQLLTNVERVFSLLLTNRDVTRILLREAVGLDPGFDRKLAEYNGRLAGLLESSLRTGLKMGLVRAVDVRVSSLMLLGALKQVLDHSLSASEPLPSPPDLARSFLDVVAAGVVKPGTMSLARR